IAGLTPDVQYSSQYNPDGSRSQLNAAFGGTADFQNSYYYDSDGRLGYLSQQGVENGHGVDSKTVIFNYDLRGQFTEIDRYGGFYNYANTFYDYDAVGRLKSLVH